MKESKKEVAIASFKVGLLFGFVLGFGTLLILLMLTT
jgi:hypothetical protein